MSAAAHGHGHRHCMAPAAAAGGPAASERGEALGRLWHWLRAEVPGAYCHPALCHARSGHGADDWGCAVGHSHTALAAGTRVVELPSKLCAALVRAEEEHAELILVTLSSPALRRPPRAGAPAAPLPPSGTRLTHAPSPGGAPRPVCSIYASAATPVGRYHHTVARRRVAVHTAFAERLPKNKTKTKGRCPCPVTRDEAVPLRARSTRQRKQGCRHPPKKRSWCSRCPSPPRPARDKLRPGPQKLPLRAGDRADFSARGTLSTILR